MITFFAAIYLSARSQIAHPRADIFPVSVLIYCWFVQFTRSWDNAPVLMSYVPHIVCAVALRYSDKPEVYPIAMHFSQKASADALICNHKHVEMCQAYILMSNYSVPTRRFEEDPSWMYTGIAIRYARLVQIATHVSTILMRSHIFRTATDLNLHRLPPKKPQTEQQELEMLNHVRTWINCCNLDKSMATQFGKPSTLKED